MLLTPKLVGVLIWLVACLAALAWGGRPERRVSLLLLANLAAVATFPWLAPGDAVRWWTLGWDVAVLAGMILVQARTPRAWLLSSMGAQLVSVLAHIPRIIDPGIRRWAYVAATTYAGYFVILALVAGTILNVLRRGDPLDAQQRSR